ncbi:MAG: FeoA family protein [Verrucomicrobiales bacterium]|nr:FeoA family protein [Verrucomicrobiales bacterium]
MTVSKTIADLVPDDTAVISGFSAEGAHLRRFREMGLMKGTTIKVIRFAPLGDPIEIAVRGSLLSIRGEEATLINVDMTEEAADKQSTV